jgi:hypothetical protein
MKLSRFSIGIGDRFGQQGKALLAGIIDAANVGVEITPVWNKSHREHTITGTTPVWIRAEADGSAELACWTGHYFVDADHINLKTVDLFIETCDFFTLDVADFINQAARRDELDEFVAGCEKYANGVSIPGGIDELVAGADAIRAIGNKFLAAVKQAGKLYRHIAAKKGVGNFVIELSMDETDMPQTPLELLFILASAAQEEIPVQTIAPRFIGRFNKGVDYAGDVDKFTRDFERLLAVVEFAKEEFGLPRGLKLSVHSGSDKFSIYEPINRALKKFDAGLHVKTSGTTWLEELAGLAIAEGEGLRIAKHIYAQAFSRIDELTKPYETVIDIDRRRLPQPEVVAEWDGKRYADELRHDAQCGRYNPHFRQLMHVGYKVAAEMGKEFIDAVADCQRIIGPNVTENIFKRHIKPIFID